MSVEAWPEDEVLVSIKEGEMNIQKAGSDDLKIRLRPSWVGILRNRCKTRQINCFIPTAIATWSLA